MAKMIRLVLAVAADKLADVIDALAEHDVTASISTNHVQSDGTIDDDDIERATVAMAGQSARRRPVAEVPRRTSSGESITLADDGPSNAIPAARQTINPRMGRRVVYTPAGTKRQILAVLEQLRGQDTMRAYVYRDLAKHPGSLNSDVRKRLAAPLAKIGKSPESVDNTIWTMVNKGLVSKTAVD